MAVHCSYTDKSILNQRKAISQTYGGLSIYSLRQNGESKIPHGSSLPDYLPLTTLQQNLEDFYKESNKTTNQSSACGGHLKNHLCNWYILSSLLTPISQTLVSFDSNYKDFNFLQVILCKQCFWFDYIFVFLFNLY